MDDKIVAAVAAVEVREVEEQEETDFEQPERIEKVVENSMDYYGSSGKSPDKENVGDEELAATPIPERALLVIHVPAQFRQFDIYDSEFFVTPNGKADILASLCKMYDTSEDELKKYS